MLELTVPDSTQLNNKDLTQLSHLRLSDKAREIIARGHSIYGQSREIVAELIQTLRDVDKLKSKQILDVVFTELPFLSRPTIYRALEDQGITRKYERKPIEDKTDKDKVIEYIPKPIEQPTTQEREYIDSISSEQTTTQVMTEESEVYYKISQEDKQLLNKARYIQQEGFIFTTDPQIWKNDTGKGFAEEFNLPENRDKRFILLVQEER